MPSETTIVTVDGGEAEGSEFCQPPTIFVEILFQPLNIILCFGSSRGILSVLPVKLPFTCMSARNHLIQELKWTFV